MFTQVKSHVDTLSRDNDSEVVICNNVLQSILERLTNSDVEQGGILGRRAGMVTEFYYDEGAECSIYSYKPDLQTLNKVISDWFYEKETEFIGFIHTHPLGCDTLSLGDLNIMRSLLEESDNLTSILALILEQDMTTHQYRLNGYNVTL